MSRQRFLPAMFAALALATVHAGAASAAHVARMEVKPAQVAAGGEVSVYGTPSWAPVPVSIHWNSVDGEVLGTFPTTSGGNAQWGPGTVKIPDVPPGVYDLVGTQDPPATQVALRGVPARARVIVTGPGGALPPEAKGTPPLQGLGALKEEGPKTSSLVLLAAAVFVVTLALGLLPGWILRRRAVAS
ncbi:MAG: hypothetical protein ACRD03_02285 [Acidimicrobiales bacterium]